MKGIVKRSIVFLAMSLFALPASSEDILAENSDIMMTKGINHINGKKILMCRLSVSAKNDEGIGILAHIKLINPKSPSLLITYIPRELPEAIDKQFPKATFGNIVIGNISTITYPHTLKDKYNHLLIYHKPSSDLINLQTKIVEEKPTVKLIFKREEFDKEFQFTVNVADILNEEIDIEPHRKCLSEFMEQMKDYQTKN